ncbi:uncharacterized protein LOC128961439 isoform X2 [Oppia nitens]|uniref:uncharacterized protein LOC128961439 isoform X2 n=1 Tax=Oppia nitens TaxID=1686743 RepID=UPI0023DC58BB|nr:uncharacterized protein LOC128961439 isoform X2 [Oppia nitens]
MIASDGNTSAVNDSDSGVGQCTQSTVCGKSVVKNRYKEYFIEDGPRVSWSQYHWIQAVRHRLNDKQYYLKIIDLYGLAAYVTQRVNDIQMQTVVDCTLDWIKRTIKSQHYFVNLWIERNDRQQDYLYIQMKKCDYKLSKVWNIIRRLFNRPYGQSMSLIELRLRLLLFYKVAECVSHLNTEYSFHGKLSAKHILFDINDNELSIRGFPYIFHINNQRVIVLDNCIDLYKTSEAITGTDMLKLDAHSLGLILAQTLELHEFCCGIQNISQLNDNHNPYISETMHLTNCYQLTGTQLNRAKQLMGKAIDLVRGLTDPRFDQRFDSKKALKCIDELNIDFKSVLTDTDFITAIKQNNYHFFEHFVRNSVKNQAVDHNTQQMSNKATNDEPVTAVTDAQSSRTSDRKRTLGDESISTYDKNSTKNQRFI